VFTGVSPSILWSMCISHESSVFSDGCTSTINRWEINHESLMFISANYMIHNISYSWLISYRSILDLRSSTNTDDLWEIDIDDKVEGDTPVNIGDLSCFHPMYHWWTLMFYWWCPSKKGAFRLWFIDEPWVVSTATTDKPSAIHP